jgi:hypothetical protein
VHTRGLGVGAGRQAAAAAAAAAGTGSNSSRSFECKHLGLRTGGSCSSDSSSIKQAGSNSRRSFECTDLSAGAGQWRQLQLQYRQLGVVGTHHITAVHIDSLLTWHAAVCGSEGDMTLDGCSQTKARYTVVNVECVP